LLAVDFSFLSIRAFIDSKALVGKEKMRENLERESEGVFGSLEGNQIAPEGRGGDLGTMVSYESVPVTRKRCDFFQYLDKITTPFFFTHFPDSLNNSDLRKLFSRFGKKGNEGGGRRSGGNSGGKAVEAFRREGTSYTNAVSGRRGTTEEIGGRGAVLDLLPSEERLLELQKAYIGILRHHGGGTFLQQGLILKGLNNIKVTPMGGEMMLLQSDVKGEITRAAVNHKP